MIIAYVFFGKNGKPTWPSLLSVFFEKKRVEMASLHDSAPLRVLGPRLFWLFCQSPKTPYVDVTREIVFEHERQCAVNGSLGKDGGLLLWVSVCLGRFWACFLCFCCMFLSVSVCLCAFLCASSVSVGFVLWSFVLPSYFLRSPFPFGLAQFFFGKDWNMSKPPRHCAFLYLPYLCFFCFGEFEEALGSDWMRTKGTLTEIFFAQVDLWISLLKATWWKSHLDANGDVLPRAAGEHEISNIQWFFWNILVFCHVLSLQNGKIMTSFLTKLRSL